VVSGVEITRGSLRKKINTINIKKKIDALDYGAWLPINEEISA